MACRGMDIGPDSIRGNCQERGLRGMEKYMRCYGGRSKKSRSFGGKTNASLNSFFGEASDDR